MPLYFLEDVPLFGCIIYRIYRDAIVERVVFFEGRTHDIFFKFTYSLCERKISHTVKIELLVLRSGDGCNLNPIPSTCKNKQQIRNNSQTNGNSIKHGFLLGAQCKFHLPQQLHKMGWGCSTPQHVVLSLWNMEKLAIPSSFTYQINTVIRYILEMVHD